MSALDNPASSEGAVGKRPFDAEYARRRAAADLFEEGKGYKAVSTALGINRETVRDWSYIWRAFGSESFCHVRGDGERAVYPPEVKRAAVKDRMEGKSMVEVMAKYGIRSRHQIKEWCRIAAKKEGFPE